MNFLSRAFKLPKINKLLNLTSLFQQPFSSYQLQIYQSSQPPVLIRKPDEILITRWWSETAFDNRSPLSVPIFDFLTGQYTGQLVELEQDIFNIPLRRDIVHCVYHWNQNLGFIQTHAARRKGTVAGSGKKPSKQKGSGRARTGNKRAPGRYHQGKAHGPVPRDRSYQIPQKVQLQGIKCMLSAKLAEGKLRIINSETIDEPKTKVVSNIIKEFSNNSILFITGYKMDQNFERAHKNLQLLDVLQPHKLDIFKLLKYDRIFITLEGLRQLTEDLQDRQKYLFTQKSLRNKLVLQSRIERQSILSPEQLQEEQVVYDPSKPLTFKFKILEDYYKEYEKSRTQNVESTTQQ